MAGVTAHGGTFTFGTVVTATITSISVESPSAEIVDMTGTAVTSAATIVLVPTGGWSGGSVSVDYIHGPGANPHDYVTKVGTLRFASGGYTVARMAILELASASAGVGEIVKGTMRFRLTDHTVTDV